MSKFKEVVNEEQVIREAKYRVKNAEGKYEIVYLETSADQVETNANKQFISAAEKAKIVSNESAIAQEVTDRTQADNALAGRLTAIEGEGEGSIKKALKDAKDYTDAEIGKINDVNGNLGERVDTLEGEMTKVSGRVDATEADIVTIKESIANKNHNTIVVNEISEIVTSNPAPKVGDMAFVLSVKKAYIYKGVDAPETFELPTPPAGWILFDEISTEVDLVAYLKKSEADATYRKLADKIAEADLATDLATKINSKLDGGQVDTKISAAVNPVSDKANANEAAVNKEVTDRKAEDTKLNNRISKFVPSISSTEPEGTEAGHVWLEILAPAE